MSAAGAPPPPPPPPPHLSATFDDLPAELLLSIYAHLNHESIINFALAIYPTLRRHGLVPELTPEIIVRLSRSLSLNSGQVYTGTSKLSLQEVPTELLLTVMENLGTEDTIALTMAIEARLFDACCSSREMERRLWIWRRREKEKK